MTSVDARNQYVASTDLAEHGGARERLGRIGRSDAMKMIKIRELRGSTLEKYARAGELVGLTRDRALIAVVVPMVQAWVEHVIKHSCSQLRQSMAAAEAEMDSEADLVTLDDVLAEAAAKPDPPQSQRHAGAEQVGDVSRSRHHAGAAADQHFAASAERATAALGFTRENTAKMIKSLAAEFGMDAGKGGDSHITLTSAIGIRDLSARRIEEAGQVRELLVLTNDRMLIGIVVPISPRLVEFLVSQNLSRVIYNIQVSEQRAAAGELFTTLDEVLAHDKPAHDVHPWTSHDDLIQEWAPSLSERAGRTSRLRDTGGLG